MQRSVTPLPAPRSVRRYEWVAAHAPLVSPPAEELAGATFFSEEIAVCREMAELLPRHIAQLQRKQLAAR